MATKNRIAYALPIIQIMKILSAKSHKQMRLRLIYRERVGVISKNLIPYFELIKELTDVVFYQAALFYMLI